MINLWYSRMVDFESECEFWPIILLLIGITIDIAALPGKYTNKGKVINLKFYDCWRDIVIISRISGIRNLLIKNVQAYKICWKNRTSYLYHLAIKRHSLTSTENSNYFRFSSFSILSWSAHLGSTFTHQRVSWHHLNKTLNHIYANLTSPQNRQSSLQNLQ